MLRTRHQLTFLSTANVHHLHFPSPFVPLPCLLRDDSTTDASNATSHTHTSSVVSAVLQALPVHQLQKPRPPNTSICHHVYLTSPPALRWECMTLALALSQVSVGRQEFLLRLPPTASRYSHLRLPPRVHQNTKTSKHVSHVAIRLCPEQQDRIICP